MNIKNYLRNIALNLNRKTVLNKNKLKCYPPLLDNTNVGNIKKITSIYRYGDNGS